MSAPLVEVLTFDGCPHAGQANELVARVLDESGIAADVRRVDVTDAESAEVHRFLTSPTIRVNSRDLEPAADERDQFVLSCRVYRTERGMQGEPDEPWLRDALRAAA